MVRKVKVCTHVEYMIECMFVMCPCCEFWEDKEGGDVAGEGTDGLRDWGSESETLKHAKTHATITACKHVLSQSRYVHITFILYRMNSLKTHSLPLCKSAIGPVSTQTCSTTHSPSYALLVSPSTIHEHVCNLGWPIHKYDLGSPLQPFNNRGGVPSCHK